MDNDVTYDEHVEMENQLMLARVREQRKRWKILAFVIGATMWVMIVVAVRLLWAR